MTAFLLLVGAYVLGATPTALWVGRGLFGVDLRREGSGNLGATNTLRTLGWKAAGLVMLGDVFKGFLPVAFFPGLAGVGSPAWLVAFGAAAIAGHVFSFWVGFRGGKGVATSTGVFLALAPWALAIALVVWAATVALSRWVSLGSVLAAVALPPAVLLTPHRGGQTVVAFSIFLALFILWSHRANIGRIRRGEERRITVGSGAGRAR